jgi:hypothetical protein
MNDIPELRGSRLDRGKARYSLKNSFEENKHPRSADGKFGKGGKSDMPDTFSLNPKKMKDNPIPKDLKAKWAKAGGINNPEYKKWIWEHWA